MAKEGKKSGPRGKRGEKQPEQPPSPDTSDPNWYLEQKPLPILRLGISDILEMARVKHEEWDSGGSPLGKVQESYQPAKIFRFLGIKKDLED